MRKVTQLVDPYLLIPYALISLLSVMVIYSSNAQLAQQQAMFAGIGIGIFISFAAIPAELIFRLRYVGLLITTALLLMVMLFSQEIRGSQRWLEFGFVRIQPSELAKIVGLLIISERFSHLQGVRKDLYYLATSGILLLPLILFIFLQPDLGTMLTIIFLWIGLLLLSRVNVPQLIVTLSLFITSIPAAWLINQIMTPGYFSMND